MLSVPWDIFCAVIKGRNRLEALSNAKRHAVKEVKNAGNDAQSGNGGIPVRSGEPVKSHGGNTAHALPQHTDGGGKTQLQNQLYYRRLRHFPVLCFFFA